jgi:hypothetical protein
MGWVLLVHVSYINNHCIELYIIQHKIHHFKWMFQWSLVYSLLFIHHIYFQNLPNTPERNPICISSAPTPLTSSPTTFLLSLWICLWWIFYIHGIVKSIKVSDFFKLTVVFSVFFHLVARMSDSFFFINGWIPTLCLSAQHLGWPFFSWWTALCSHTWAVMWNNALNTCEHALFFLHKCELLFLLDKYTARYRYV